MSLSVKLYFVIIVTSVIIASLNSCISISFEGLGGSWNGRVNYPVERNDWKTRMFEDFHQIMNRHDLSSRIDYFRDSRVFRKEMDINYPAKRPLIVTRDEWGARTPRHETKLRKIPHYVITHHTAKPNSCNSREECTRAMKSIQEYHMDKKGWDDTGYNYLIGNGEIYEGRGSNNVGAHATGLNSNSIGIAFIGDHTTTEVSTKDSEAFQTLINKLVETGKLSPNYKVQGHRDVSNSKCPGDAAHDLIKTFPRFIKKED